MVAAVAPWELGTTLSAQSRVLGGHTIAEWGTCIRTELTCHVVEGGKMTRVSLHTHTHFVLITSLVAFALRAGDGCDPVGGAH